MVRNMTISETRNKLTSLHKDLDQEETVAVTSRGKPVLALMGWELYESLAETLEVLTDPELYAALRQSIKEADAGNLIPFDVVEKELG